jgi:hypothetical protein
MTKIMLALEPYEKILRDNKEEFKDAEQLSDFIDAYLSENRAITDLEDYISEHADSLVPIYYNEIMEEWRNNGECHGMAEEQGILGDNNGDVYKIMQVDLFCWYDQILRDDYNKLLELLEDQEEEPEPEEPEEVKE